MRKPKSVSEFSSERNLLLLENFRRAIARQSEIALANAFKDAAERPAPRFWVSETRAAVIIGKILAGKDPISSMTPEKREMYQEILRRFIALRETRPDESIQSIIFEVVNQEAPRAYMSWETARSIIYREQRKRRLERRGI